MVTIDAMGCQKDIAQQIVDQQADYILAVKENQEHLYEDIEHLFSLYLQEPDPRQYVDDYVKTVNKGHGRIEIRECWTLSATFHQSAIRNAGEWKNLNSLVCIRRERRLAEKTEVKLRYYIARFPPKADVLLRNIRGHWGIENSVH